jgi:hypothetical protein
VSVVQTLTSFSTEPAAIRLPRGESVIGEKSWRSRDLDFKSVIVLS